MQENLKHTEALLKMSQFEYTIDPNKFNEIHNLINNVLSFNSVTDLNKTKIVTDADVYGGDTEAQLTYNIKEDAMVITGHFEMKSKHLIEDDKMFAKVYFKNLKEYYFDKINLVRIKIKTNGHNVNLLLEEDFARLDTSFYKAYILDTSDEFRTYEVLFLNSKFYI
jgi:hypothetical protein